MTTATRRGGHLSPWGGGRVVGWGGGEWLEVANREGGVGME